MRPRFKIRCTGPPNYTFLDGPPTGPVSQTVEWEDAAGDLHWENPDGRSGVETPDGEVVQFDEEGNQTSIDGQAETLQPTEAEVQSEEHGQIIQHEEENASQGNSSGGNNNSSGDNGNPPPPPPDNPENPPPPPDNPGNGDGNGSTIEVQNLGPLHSPETSGVRPDLANLSDDDLLQSVNNPANNDPLRINTRTGKVVDGNGRAWELLRRAADPNSSISPNTIVRYEPYTPDNSMFWDLDLP